MKFARRYDLWIVIGAFLAVAILIVWPFNISTRRLIVTNYPHVRVGLTQDQVEQLMGGPPGNYGLHGGSHELTMEGFRAPPGSTERCWSDDTHRIEIWFDSQNRVVGHHKRFRYEQHPESLNVRLRRIIASLWFL